MPAWRRSRRLLAALDDRPAVFDPAEVARAGAFVSIGADGWLRVERGYVRPEDELPIAPELRGRAVGWEPDGTG